MKKKTVLTPRVTGLIYLVVTDFWMEGAAREQAWRDVGDLVDIRLSLWLVQDCSRGTAVTQVGSVQLNPQAFTSCTESDGST